MKILVGPDSFKDSISAYDFCKIAEKVIYQYWPEDEVVSMPLADGGEGTVEALVAGSAGEMIKITVTGPLGDLIDAHYGLIHRGEVAIIEMAAASGLPLIPKELRNPMKTTTFGTGEMIKHAVSKGVRKIIIGIGGSATSDAGLGMMQALGFRCLDENEQEVAYGGDGLAKLVKIIPPPDLALLNQIEVQVACDVNNPLYGKRGAAYVYGPQKGATPQMVEQLDAGLRNFAAVVKESLGIEVDQISGGGAAGGLGAGLVSSLGGVLKPGFDIVKEQVGLEKLLNRDIDLIITAEGQMNNQSLSGKLPVELAKLGKKYNTPTIAIVGSRDISFEKVKDHGIIGVFPIASGPMTLETSMEQGAKLIEDTLVNVLQVVHGM